MLFYNYKVFLSRFSSSTQENYLNNVNLYLRFLKEYKGNCDRKTILNVTKADIYNYIAYMDHLSKGTKRIRLLSIKNYYSFLNRNLSDYLFQDIKLFDFTQKLPKTLSKTQIRLLLNYYKDKRNSLIIFLFLNTGIRISELTNILIENINLQEKFIKLKVKGGYFRNVYINETTKQRLSDYIQDKNGRLFNLTRRQIHNIVTIPMKKLGIKGSAHTLRHTYATEMYKETRDIRVVQELLGHKSIISTEIYTHVHNEILKEAVNSNPLANFGIGERNESSSFR